ncbi:MAG: hypothetical protein ACJAZO_003844 [Myxococcota bacterium]|jgi:hypothetical protein
MSRAVCVRCGADRMVYDQVCPACGFLPDGDGLAVAWLLSDNHLGDKELDAAQVRVRAGDPIEPNTKMLKVAKRALRTTFATDPGLTTRQRLGVLACSLLLTPLVGWTLWWTWRIRRPRAAWQAFALSAPATVAFAVLVVYLS